MQQISSTFTCALGAKKMLPLFMCCLFNDATYCIWYTALLNGRTIINNEQGCERKLLCDVLGVLIPTFVRGLFFFSLCAKHQISRLYKTTDNIIILYIVIFKLFDVTQEYIVMYRPTVRQRLGKHIPAEAYECNNRAFTARQRISKQSSIIGCVSAWCVPRGYKGAKEGRLS
jgi:hypothetical protein